jgi:hypothetical protein
MLQSYSIHIGNHWNPTTLEIAIILIHLGELLGNLGVMESPTNKKLQIFSNSAG